MGSKLVAGRRAGESGFTLLEFMIALAILGLIASLAVPAYSRYVERARVAQAIAEVRQLEIRIERFRTQNGRLPDDLEELGQDGVTDPWDEPYRYLEIASSVAKGKVTGKILGKVRKDRNLVPINLDFDLYSVGADRQSKLPLVTPVSEDDVVRAGSGSFVGLAKEY